MWRAAQNLYRNPVLISRIFLFSKSTNSVFCFFIQIYLRYCLLVMNSRLFVHYTTVFVCDHSQSSWSECSSSVYLLGSSFSLRKNRPMSRVPVFLHWKQSVRGSYFEACTVWFLCIRCGASSQAEAGSWSAAAEGLCRTDEDDSEREW